MVLGVVSLGEDICELVVVLIESCKERCVQFPKSDFQVQNSKESIEVFSWSLLVFILFPIEILKHQSNRVKISLVSFLGYLEPTF